MTIHEACKGMKLFLDLNAMDFIDSIISAATKKYSLNIIKLNDWMIKNKGYNEKNGSLSNFILEKYGQDAVAFIKACL